MKYGRRYYDKTCRVCGEEKKTVLTLHGLCIRCMLKKFLYHPIFCVAILIIVAVGVYLWMMVVVKK